MIKRSLQKKCRELAGKFPVLTITGPRQSGKTTLSRLLFPEKPYVNLENLDERSVATADPRGFLKNYPKGAILDEIQRVPELVSYIQGIVDEKNTPGMFILTGSQQLEISASTSQSLAGRTAIVKLLPLSLRELKSLGSIPHLNNLLIKGFYPGLHTKHMSPNDFYGSYFETYVERDVRQLSQIENLHIFEKFVQLLAGRIGSLLNYNSIANDLGVSHPTIRTWISILEASYLIYLLPPYFSNIGKRLIKTPKLYFYDVGLASYLLGIETEAQLFSHPLRGNLFENFVVIEHLKQRFNSGLRSNLYFYRDRVGNEVDLIMEEADKLRAIEIKASETINKDFTKGLNFLGTVFGKKLSEKTVIYGGTKKHTVKDISFVPWEQIGQ